ncbi:snurportin-1 [Phtheirospermum japonicum]|uniref:Snurportin-1 n=1 Tax=Phtheirospermum japonicum TaxID=374723 RepID=A0A830C4S7_9LAMI|nr:snurportin-1 [Phtheirospermum japonicum]
MAPHDLRRPFKRAAISDQQRRRELSLQRQAQHRRDAQHQARCLAQTILSLQNDSVEPDPEPEIEMVPQAEEQAQSFDVRQAASLRGPEARRWFAKQLMLPEWMIDVPERLNTDWYVYARPSGKRCFVVSSNGTTVSRLRNGSMLHRFPSALPNGAKANNSSRSGQSYCILDCIFHEPDQTYYVIDMVCWAGISMYECTAEFRYFWLHSKLVESGACNEPSTYHRYSFKTVEIYNCDGAGLKAAYNGSVPYVKDGLLFCNMHAHYESGNTPLVLVWKDENCSQYVLDTDSKGHIPDQQQVVLELLDDGRLATSDDPPVIFGCLDRDFVQKTELQAGNLLRFTINEGGLCFADGKLERADLQYLGKSNRSRAFADSYSKVMFQYTARHSPLSIDHLFASVISSSEENTCDTDMVG